MVLSPGQMVTVAGQQIICLPLRHILNERVCWLDGYGQIAEHRDYYAYHYEEEDLTVSYAASGWSGRPNDDDFSACDPIGATVQNPIGVIEWIEDGDNYYWSPPLIKYDFYGNTIYLWGDSNSPGGVPHTTNFFILSKSWTHYGLFARPLPVDEDFDEVVIVPIVAGVLLLALLLLGLSGYAGRRRLIDVKNIQRDFD